jgi:mono/diheme cytochrome c family protein
MPVDRRPRMQWSGLGLVAVWWMVLGIPLAVAQPPASPSEAVDGGRDAFVRYCSACHGQEGRGDGPAAAVLQPPPADLTRIAQRRGGHFPVAEITAYIDGRRGVRAHGSQEMPIWGERFGEMLEGDALGEGVTQSYLRWLVEYLQAIQQ